MTLREQQSLFVNLVGKLIAWAFLHGYELTFGETVRSVASAAVNAAAGTGITRSLHTDRLAIDFNLFVNGTFVQDSEGHRPLGAYWKTLHPLCRWGGDFSKPDGNHYSMQWGGRR